MAVGVGFEPTVPIRYNGFRDRPIQPLSHPTVKVQHTVKLRIFNTGNTPRIILASGYVCVIFLVGSRGCLEEGLHPIRGREVSLCEGDYLR